MRDCPAFILQISFFDEGVCLEVKFLSHLELSRVCVALTMFGQIG